MDEEITLNMHFDFVALNEQKYSEDPRKHYAQDGLAISVFYTPSQREVLRNYFRQYGTMVDGLSYFIHRHPARMLYREVAYGDRVSAAGRALAAPKQTSMNARLERIL